MTYHYTLGLRRSVPPHCVNNERAWGHISSVFKINLVDTSGDTWSSWYLLYMNITEKNLPFLWLVSRTVWHRSHRIVALSTYSSRQTVAFYLPCCHRSARNPQSFWSRERRESCQSQGKSKCIYIAQKHTSQFESFFQLSE